jgi:AcrR family transcriptional regulator
MSTAPRWQRLERDERREQILACARRLFSERSYATVSTSEIAAEAGVARGLLHHYFGTKRELYLEVVRALVRTPPTPIPRAGSGEALEAVIGEAADRWLEMLERNRGTWLAAVGGQGLGSDPEVEAILDEARESACARLIDALDPPPSGPPDGLKAVVRAYGGMCEVASVEWLRRGRLSREQVRAVVVSGFLAAVGELYDAVTSAAPV